MHRIMLCLLSLLCLSTPLSAQEWNVEDIRTYRSFDAFEHLLNRSNDSIYAVNFWATWCKPCVAEMPYFEELGNKVKDQPVKIILVSLDFENQVESRLVPYLNKNKISSDVVLLLDEKASNWIDKVDTRWGGSIPATLFYRGKERKFFEKAFHSTGELEEIIHLFK